MTLCTVCRLDGLAEPSRDAGGRLACPRCADLDTCAPPATAAASAAYALARGLGVVTEDTAQRGLEERLEERHRLVTEPVREHERTIAAHRRTFRIRTS